MKCKSIISLTLLFICTCSINCNVQMGPDPWDYVSTVHSDTNNEDVPPDLSILPQKKTSTNNANNGMMEWFYKRTLAIILKGGQVKKNEDGSVEIALQMRYNSNQWNLLNEYILSSTALSEDMLRRSTGFIEEAIYKPTITEKIAMAWSEYIQYYLIEYKILLTWTFTILTVLLTAAWMWSHLSSKHVLLLIIIGLYIYEVFTSYKEVEKQELDRFITAVNTCKWFIWTAECEVPPPDPLVFIKHMNPLKIGVRMFTTLLSEPMITLSEAVKTMIHGITDGLWFPLDKLMYGTLMLVFNVLIIFIIIMIIFNFILNIPFKLSILGIFNFGISQRHRSFPNANVSETQSETTTLGSGDRISGETLSRLLDVCSRALHTAETTRVKENTSKQNLPLTYKNTLKKSASTGRLSNLCSE